MNSCPEGLHDISARMIPVEDLKIALVKRVWNKRKNKQGENLKNVTIDLILFLRISVHLISIKR
jgi:hypothetical protein